VNDGVRVGVKAGKGAILRETEMQEGVRDYQDAWRAAIDYGIDVSLLEYNLTRTPEERLVRHEQARLTVTAVHRAGIAYYGFDPRAAESPD